jgi:hypothetical protein
MARSKHDAIKNKELSPLQAAQTFCVPHAIWKPRCQGNENSKHATEKLGLYESIFSPYL